MRYTKAQQQQLIKARIACLEADYPASEAQYGSIVEWEQHTGYQWKWNPQSTLVPHKHAAVIKAWADGATIQWRRNEKDMWIDWSPLEFHSWGEDKQWRVKPERKPNRVIDLLLEKRPGYAPFIYASMDEYTGLPARTWQHNVKATFDGETNKLIKVEMI